MSSPLNAAYYADHCRCETATICHREQLATETFLVRFICPNIARVITPGQFVMVRLPGCHDPILGRAFALYDVGWNEAGDPTSLDIVFHVVGKTTGLLSQAGSGDAWEIWGPLGNGFEPRPANHLVMVAGGIGQTPFLALAKEYLGKQAYGQSRDETNADRVSLCYGARSAEFLAGVEHFRALGVDVHMATDDGTAGHRGLVVDLLDGVARGPADEVVRMVCCGPERMMEAVANWAHDAGVDCEVSLETPMACGLGICFSCVTRVKDSQAGWDYKRTCVDGPVFDASRIAW